MSNEKLPTLEDLAEEEANPTVAVLVTRDGEPIRNIRKDEFDKMKHLAGVLADDSDFWGSDNV